MNRRPSNLLLHNHPRKQLDHQNMIAYTSKAILDNLVLVESFILINELLKIQIISLSIIFFHKKNMQKQLKNQSELLR